MKRKPDDMSFEGAWQKQYDEEKVADKPESEKKEIKVHHEPAFRGQRDIVDTRSKIKMPSKQKENTEDKKEVTIVDAPSSKEGDEFDVEW